MLHFSPHALMPCDSKLYLLLPSLLQICDLDNPSRRSACSYVAHLQSGDCSGLTVVVHKCHLSATFDAIECSSPRIPYTTQHLRTHSLPFFTHNLRFNPVVIVFRRSNLPLTQFLLSTSSRRLSVTGYICLPSSLDRTPTTSFRASLQLGARIVVVASEPISRVQSNLPPSSR